MRWIAEWREIDISRGILNASFTGAGAKKRVIIDFDGDWYVAVAGTPGYPGYDNNSFFSLAAAKRYLRSTQNIPPYTRFKEQQ